MKPVLAFDGDGVLVDFTTPALAYMNGNGFPKTLEQVTNWSVFDNNEELEDAFKRDVASKPWFCRNMQPYPGAVEFALAAQKEYEVVIVTAPYNVPNWYDGRRDWMVEKLGLSRKKVNFLSEKEYFDSDILVDDKTVNVQKWHDRLSARADAAPGSWGSHLAILFDQPWNRNDFITFSVQRATSYQVISDVLEAHGFPPVKGNF